MISRRFPRRQGPIDPFVSVDVDRCEIILASQDERQLAVPDEGKSFSCGIVHGEYRFRIADLCAHFVRQVVRCHGAAIGDFALILGSEVVLRFISCFLPQP